METTNTTETPQAAESKWFVLRVVSGKERKVKEYLDKEVSRGGWDKIVKQVFLPVEKVTWPTWTQLQQSTMIVIAATLVITALVAGMDFVTNVALKFIYNIF